MAVINNTVGIYDEGLYLVEDKKCDVKNIEGTLVTIIFNNGISLTCDSEQEIYTEQGLVKAIDLKIWNKPICQDKTLVTWNNNVIDDEFAKFLGIYFLNRSNQAPLNTLTKFINVLKSLLTSLENRIPDLKLSECQGLSDKMLAVLLTSKQGSFGIPYDVNNFALPTASVFIDTIADIYGNEFEVKKEAVRNFLYLYINLLTTKQCVVKNDNIVLGEQKPLSIKTIKYNDSVATLYTPVNNEGYIYCNGIKLQCNKLLPKRA